MNDSEAVMSRRLARMRWIATGLLLAMAALFVATSLLIPRYPWLGLVQAFAEAGLIGALADWFAVTALFRHPLGLPIPHTAIVPTRKDEIGRMLADFIRDQFLVRETVAARLAKVDLAARAGEWLSEVDNAKNLGRNISVALVWLLDATGNAQLRHVVRETLGAVLDRAPLSPALQAGLDVISSEEHLQAVVDRLLRTGREELLRNREFVRQQIGDQSPWWLPKMVDREIQDQLIGALLRALDEIGNDPNHPARARFGALMIDFVASAGDDPELKRQGRALKNEFLDHPAVQNYFAEVWKKSREFLLASLRDPHSLARLAIDGELRGIGHGLRQDSEANTQVNRWLRDLILHLVENWREPLGNFISETVEQWDAADTSARIELYVGRDLQFIRINGTIVGGLVGVAIYLLWGLVG